MADSDRVAELKRKMQEAAQRAKAEAATGETDAAPKAAVSSAPAAAQPSAPEAPAVAQAVATAQAPAIEAAAEPAIDTPAAPTEKAVEHSPAVPPVPAMVVAEPVAPAITSTQQGAQQGTTNGAASGAALAAGALDDTSYLPQVLSPEELAKREMNRREFLTYAWGGALLLVTGATGFGLFQFMYPRFKAGEFGGQFFLGPVSALPPTDAPPEGITAGKFWLVNSADEGIKALYMVCTHLGCLYKWEPSTVRFECPCHGSKFSREGYYIEGPAPRSLDRFETIEANGELVVDTGAKISGSPASESPARAAA